MSAFDQVGMFACVDEKTDVVGVINQRESESQSPRVKLWDEICHYFSRFFFQGGRARKQ